MLQIVPLTSVPNQTLSVPLNIDGTVKNFIVTLRYNEIAGYWVMQVQDSTGTVVVDSIPLISGDGPTSNLLAQMAYKAIGSMAMFNASSTPAGDYPTIDNLGSDFEMIWGNTPAA